ncbi:MAG: hypothetical protein WA622_19985 [Mycobacterium sp.]|uniref:hypothetical protein n=1 Tax=Mycobacterium sp. TaxID=1785 RepID=UPI003BB7DF0D
MTELPHSVARAVLQAGCLVAIAVFSGCAKTTEGVALPAGGPVASVAGPSTAQRPSTGNRKPMPGIEETLPDHIPPNAFACFPEPTGIGAGTVAQVSDPAAPRITVSVPDGWTSEPGQGDVALALTGPDGLTATVTIAATTLDPAAAFADYAGMLARSKPDLKVDTVGAKFCGYSSQKLTGAFPGSSGSLGFADRVTHIWTNADKYLVTIHAEGPADAPGFDAAKTALMQDFAVVIP